MECKSQNFDENDIAYRVNKNRQGYYGWLGYTGSILQWHPEQKIGFAFVPGESNFIDFFAQRGGSLQQLVLQCSLNEKTQWDDGNPYAGDWGCQII